MTPDELDALEAATRMAAERAGCMAAEAKQQEDEVSWAGRWGHALQEASRALFKASTGLDYAAPALIAAARRVEVLEAEVARLREGLVGRGWQPIHIVFDGPPGPEAGRFVECETPDGKSINAGTWHERDNGYWELRIAALSASPEPKP